MNTSFDKTAASSVKLAQPHMGRRRLCTTGASLAVALLATACGGGGNGGNDRPPRSFNVGVSIDGQTGNYFPITPGGSISLAIRAGQSITLEAGEPVVWNLYIGGTQVTYGAQILYAGVTIDTLNLNQYAVRLNTYAPYDLQNVANIMLIASSTYDSVQVATIYLAIGN